MATQKETAEHLDLTPRQVRNLLRDGVLPPAKPGAKGYDIEACRLAYIRYLRGVNSGQIRQKADEDEPAKDDKDPRSMLEWEKWREKKRENDLAEGMVAPIELLTDALQKVGTQIVTNLEALPLEMKRSNPRLTGHDIQSVKKAIAKCCNAIAEIQLEDVQN